MSPVKSDRVHGLGVAYRQAGLAFLKHGQATATMVVGLVRPAQHMQAPGVGYNVIV